MNGTPGQRSQPGCTVSRADWRRVWWWGGLILVAGCGTTLPQDVPRKPSPPVPSVDEPELVRIAKASSADAELSGFRLLPSGENSLQARIQLVRRAQRTLDVQYYMITNDQTGRYLLRSLRDAAERGVRVRLLVDDLHTAGDPLLLGLDAYPNVEVRLFNPFPTGRGDLVLRFAANAHDFERVNRRMHNKLLIADDVFAVAGGRNIADRYFMASSVANYVDLDVLVTGAVLPRLSAQFNEYWDSPSVYPITSIVKSRVPPEALRSEFQRLTAVQAHAGTRVRVPPAEQSIGEVVEIIGTTGGTPEPPAPPPNDLLGYAPVFSELQAGRLGMVWADARAYADSPDKARGRISTYQGIPIDDVDSVRYNVIEMIRRARTEVVLVTPFLVPGKAGMDTLRAATGKGVAFTIVTNSLAATNEPAVHTAYRRYRPEMLELGVQLYELSPGQTSRSLRLGRFSTSIGRLHAKFAVVDRELVFIGSLNFDPRSDQHNTELGLFIHSPTLAQQTLKLVDVIRGQGAYQVRLAPNGKDIHWFATGSGSREPLQQEPETDLWLRSMLEILSVLVPEDLL
jgi:putative cardiolipin synthase